MTSSWLWTFSFCCYFLPLISSKIINNNRILSHSFIKSTKYPHHIVIYTCGMLVAGSSNKAIFSFYWLNGFPKKLLYIKTKKAIIFFSTRFATTIEIHHSIPSYTCVMTDSSWSLLSF